MLLQTNSYVVPKERRAEHARLVRRFRQALHRLGCDQFEVYEQVGTNWSSDQSSGRFVQIMRFRDRKHQLAVQAAERGDATAQAVIAEFCEIINFPYQQQQGLFAIGYYTSVLTTSKLLDAPDVGAPMAPEPDPSSAVVPEVGEQMTMVVDESDLAGGSDTSAEIDSAAPIRNPFAEQPIVFGAQPVAAQEQPGEPGHTPGANGNGHPHGPEALADDFEPAAEAEAGRHTVAHDLDELIKQHFGEPEHSHTARNGDRVEATLPGSGIGAVLDAGLENDADLDIALPAELVEPPESPDPHTADLRHIREDLDHA